MTEDLKKKKLKQKWLTSQCCFQTPRQITILDGKTLLRNVWPLPSSWVLSSSSWGVIDEPQIRFLLPSLSRGDVGLAG